MNMKEATKKMKQDSPKLAGLSEAQRNLALEKVKEALLLNREAIFLERHGSCRKNGNRTGGEKTPEI